MESLTGYLYVSGAKMIMNRLYLCRCARVWDIKRLTVVDMFTSGV